MYISCKLYSEIMSRRQHLSPAKRAQCVALHNVGHSQRYIVALLHCSQNAVWNSIRSHQETGSNQDRSGGGRPHLSNPREDGLLRRIIRKNPVCTSTQIALDWEQQNGVHCGTRTVRNRLVMCTYFVEREQHFSSFLWSVVIHCSCQ